MLAIQMADDLITWLNQPDHVTKAISLLDMQKSSIQMRPVIKNLVFWILIVHSTLGIERLA